MSDMIDMGEINIGGNYSRDDLYNILAENKGGAEDGEYTTVSPMFQSKAKSSADKQRNEIQDALVDMLEGRGNAPQRGSQNQPLGKLYEEPQEVNRNKKTKLLTKVYEALQEAGIDPKNSNVVSATATYVENLHRNGFL